MNLPPPPFDYRSRDLKGSPHAWVVLFIVMTLGWGLTGWALHASRDTLEALRRSTTAQDATIGSRIGAVEAENDAQMQPAALAGASVPSVFKVEAGDSLGSAFVIASSGGTSTLMTDFHVVAGVWNQGGTSVTLRQDDQSYAGTITQVSEGADLASITVPTGFPVLSLDEEPATIGESVMVIGSPYGFENTVAIGLVSGYQDALMQFSASVSPGDSGGPVLDASGSVVGIIVSKIETKAAEGLAFATPTATLCAALDVCAS